MIAARRHRAWLTPVLLLTALVAGSALAGPPQSATGELDPVLAGKTSAINLELNRDHYDRDAAGFGTKECGEWSVDTAPGATKYDGWHFVAREGTDLRDFQIAFVDKDDALHVYRITRDAAGNVTASAAGGNIFFSKEYSHVAVLTPSAGAYRTITAADPRLVDPDGTPYSKTVYAVTQSGTTTEVIDFFNLSHTCPGRPLTPPDSPCDYPDDSSRLTVIAAGSGDDRTVSGVLSCGDTALPGEVVRLSPSTGSARFATTGADGRYTFTSVPAAALPLTISFAGSGSAPSAQPVTLAGL